MSVKERCYRACLQYGRRWEMGEERAVDNFDENGKPIASPHFRVVDAKDAPSDPEREYLTPKQRASDQEAELRGDRVFAIRAALEQLDPEVNSHWAVKGAPSLQRVHAITGLDDLQRGDLLEAWPEFDRELARSLRS